MADSVKIKITGDSAPFEKELGGLGKKAGSVFKGMMASQIVTRGFSAMVNSLKSAVNTAMDFESSMSRVQALSGATEEEFRKLTETAKAYGASTVFTASQAAEALQYMALAGWDAQQSMDALGGVLDLAAASGMDLAAASDAVTDFLSAFGMEASQAGYMADLMAYAQSKSNTSAAQLADAYGNCASSMHAAGQDIETTTAMLMALANQGIKGSEAGTQMSAVMRDLTSKMKNGKVMIGNTAVTVQDDQGNFRDLNDIIADVAKATEGLGTAEASAALMDTFTARSVKAIQTLLNEGVENVNAYEDALRGSEGTAAEQSAVMLDNLQGDIKLFQSALEGLQITAGEAFNGIAREITQEATGLLDALNAAGKRGGLEGMFDELINQLPGILDRVVGFVGQAVDKLARKLPALLKKLFSQLPKMIGKLLDLAPALIENVLSALGEVVEAVISNLPELLGRIIQALPGILMGLLKGIGRVFDGFFNGLTSALKETGILRKDVGDVIRDGIENADTSGIVVRDIELPDMTIVGGDLTEEELASYKAKVDAAMQQIRDALTGTSLTDEQQAQMEQAILKGCGQDAFKLAVQSLGLTEAEATEITTRLENARAAIDTAFATWNIDPETRKQVLQYMTLPHSIQKALTEIAGLTPEDAEAAAEKLGPAVEALRNVFTQYGLTQEQQQAIMAYVNAGGDLQTALTEIGKLKPEDAQTAAQQATAALDELNTGLEGIGLKPETIAKIGMYLFSSNTLEEALQDIANMDASDAKTAAQQIQPDLDEIEAIYNALNLDDISLDEFRQACLDANGDLEAALKLLGISDPKIAAMMSAAQQLKDKIGPLVRSLFDELAAAFTDGNAENDAAAKEMGKDTLNDLMDETDAKIDAWAEKAKTDIEAMDLSVAEMKTQMDLIDAKAQSAHDKVADLRQQGVDWIDAYGDKAGSVVRDHLDELYGIADEVDALEAAIDKVSGKVTNRAVNVRKAVERGAINDRQSITDSINLSAKERDKALADAALDYDMAVEQYNAAIDAAEQKREQSWAAGVDPSEIADTYEAETQAAKEALGEAADARAQAEADAQDAFQQHMQAIMTGGMSADEALRQWAEGLVEPAKLANLEDKLVAALTSGEMTGLSVADLLGNIGATEADVNALVEAMDLDPNWFWNALADALATGENTDLFSGSGLGAGVMTDILDGIMAQGMKGDYAEALQPFYDALKVGLEQGWLTSDEAQGLVSDGIAGMMYNGAVGAQPEPVPVKYNVDPEPADGAEEAVAESVEEATEQALDTAPATVEPTVEVKPKPELVTDGIVESEVAQAYETSLNQAAGEAELTEEAAPDTSSVQGIMSSGGKSVGKSFSEGLASGIRSGQSAAIQAAIDVARAAINAAKETLDSHSPSRVTAELGRMFDKGFEVGIDDETDAVVRSAVRLANSVVGAANLKPKLDLSGIASSVDGMAEGMAAEAQRPLVLAVNGRELGRVMASDNARAANNYNRSLALGVGKA